MDLDSGGGATGEHEFIDSLGSAVLENQEINTLTARGGKWKRSVSAYMFLCVLLLSVHSASPLQCYHCLERPKSTEKHLACAYFDMSSKFHKECTHSSFCMKRTSQFQLHNGSYVTIHVHKCADQSHKTMVQDSNGDWKWAQLFKRDLYNEGCFPHNTPSMLTTDSYHCFCSTDFCNPADSLHHHHSFLLALAVGISLLLLPLIQEGGVFSPALF